MGTAIGQHSANEMPVSKRTKFADDTPSRAFDMHSLINLADELHMCEHLPDELGFLILLPPPESIGDCSASPPKSMAIGLKRSRADSGATCSFESMVQSVERSGSFDDDDSE
jgi:hypothetical protein